MESAATTAEYLSARRTTELLDIKLQTLYAYVSRGLIRSVRQPGKKAHVYLRTDVERVAARALARSGHGPAAAEAMNHGPAIIPTSITEISDRGPSYRGRLATDMAAGAASFESVAELLWTGVWNPDSPCWKIAPPPRDLTAMVDSLGHAPHSEQLLEVFALVTLHMGLRHQTPSRRLHEADIFRDARQIIGTLVGCCGLASAQRRHVAMRHGERISDGLLRALGGGADEASRDAFSMMLVLLADHELSPGTLSARVAASGGATLHGCIASALCASSGVNVAQVFDHVHDFLASASSKAGLLKQAALRRQRGAAVPGFTHPLYPRGDPRAEMLLAFIRARMPTRPLLAVCDFVAEVERDTGLHVRHEVPMVALTRAMGLSRKAASAIFLLSRTAGWIAHIQEQRLAGQLLRPRAKFVSPPVAGHTMEALPPSHGELNNQS